MSRTRVLVVEDEAAVRDVWVDALTDAGYPTAAFGTGSDALARLAEIAPELILLDMMMPAMDGYEFLARLRAHPQGRGIPVLIVSALGESLRLAIDADSARALGVVGILPKPVPLATILEHVGRIIGPGDAAPGP